MMTKKALFKTWMLILNELALHQENLPSVSSNYKSVFIINKDFLEQEHIYINQWTQTYVLLKAFLKEICPAQCFLKGMLNIMPDRNFQKLSKIRRWSSVFLGLYTALSLIN